MARIPNIPTLSVKPGLPRKPPATSTTSGSRNITRNEFNMQDDVQYGANHRTLSNVRSGGGTRDADFAGSMYTK